MPGGGWSPLFALILHPSHQDDRPPQHPPAGGWGGGPGDSETLAAANALVSAGPPPSWMTHTKLPPANGDSTPQPEAAGQSDPCAIGGARQRI